MADAFGAAIRDFHRGTQDEPLLQRDGEETLEHPIEQFYFGTFDPESEASAWLAPHVDGPLLDVGAGAGRDTLYFQEQFQTVAIEVSDALVETMETRGVDDARRGDMFDLPAQFEAGRFQSVLSIGTQTCLAGSMAGLRSLLDDFAVVTTETGSAVLDGYDPTHEDVTELLGYREDPTDGLAHRVMYFEYEGERSTILYFRLFSPGRVREAVDETPWTVADVANAEASSYYRIALEKERASSK